MTGNTAGAGGGGGGIFNLFGTVTLEGTADPSPIVTGNCPENCNGNVAGLARATLRPGARGDARHAGRRPATRAGFCHPLHNTAACQV